MGKDEAFARVNSSLFQKAIKMTLFKAIWVAIGLGIGVGIGVEDYITKTKATPTVTPTPSNGGCHLGCKSELESRISV
jgi:hypothetical protein